jgi:glutathione synthase
MATQSTSSYPPPLTPSEQEKLVQTIKDWSIANGFAVRPAPSVVPEESNPHGIVAVNAPVTIFPSPFPKQCFVQGRTIQKAYNALYSAVSRDEEFLEQVVKE